MIAFGYLVSATVMTTWALASVAILDARRNGIEPYRLVRWCWRELRPLFLPANAMFGVAGYLLSPWLLLSSAITVPMGLLIWYVCKDIDDHDQWKRRKAKLAAKVARNGARLVVVPVSAGVR
jgi:hypothetical protein